MATHSTPMPKPKPSTASYPNSSAPDIKDDTDTKITDPSDLPGPSDRIGGMYNGKPIALRHNGGPIAKTGVYGLKKGEHVLAPDEVVQVHKHVLMAAGLKSLAKSVKG